MSDKTVAQELLRKPGQRLLLVTPRPGYLDGTGAIRRGVSVISQPPSAVSITQTFVTCQDQPEQLVPPLKAKLEPGGILWVTYPKGTSKLASDVNRDTISKYASTIGIDGVAMFSIDQTWSSKRVKLVP